MKLILFFLLFTPAFAVEVATLQVLKPSQDQVLVVTDDAFRVELEKFFMARNCRSRQIINATIPGINENHFPKSCRAEVIKFLLNSGYKADQQYSTFLK